MEKVFNVVNENALLQDTITVTKVKKQNKHGVMFIPQISKWNEIYSVQGPHSKQQHAEQNND